MRSRRCRSQENGGSSGRGQRGERSVRLEILRCSHSSWLCSYRLPLITYTPRLWLVDRAPSISTPRSTAYDGWLSSLRAGDELDSTTDDGTDSDPEVLVGPSSTMAKTASTSTSTRRTGTDERSRFGERRNRAPSDGSLMTIHNLVLRALHSWSIPLIDLSCSALYSVPALSCHITRGYCGVGATVLDYTSNAFLT